MQILKNDISYSCPKMKLFYFTPNTPKKRVHNYLFQVYFCKSKFTGVRIPNSRFLHSWSIKSSQELIRLRYESIRSSHEHVWSSWNVSWTCLVESRTCYVKSVTCQVKSWTCQAKSRICQIKSVTYQLSQKMSGQVKNMSSQVIDLSTQARNMSGTIEEHFMNMSGQVSNIIAGRGVQPPPFWEPSTLFIISPF